MSLRIFIPKVVVNNILKNFGQISCKWFVIGPAIVLAMSMSTFVFMTDTMVSYGDAESHLNIAKRVIHSLTPGAAQLGGIWLPLPHILMLPFVWIDFLWRSGLAGAIVSGICYVIAAVTLYKLVFFLTKQKTAALLSTWLFLLNPNILYLQATAMTELPLISCFLLSSYFFTKFLKGEKEVVSLVLSAIFGFAAVLSRYDGWFLVSIQTGLIVLHGLTKKWGLTKIKGLVILFSTCTFFGIVLWLLWGQLILGNAFYFTQSEFSARTQQQGWFAKGQLPAYHNFPLAFLYYFITSLSNSGLVIFLLGLVGISTYILKHPAWTKVFISVLLLVPFIFYVLTLYIGQSVIFIPHLTPSSFEWRLFNVRYGVMMVPVVAIFVGILWRYLRAQGKSIVLLLLLFQTGLFFSGYSKAISMIDGTEGLSHAKKPDAEVWLKNNYSNGLVLMDDYSRITSIIRSGIPMQNIIYIGNRPYWEESLKNPEKYASWIVMQKSDVLWNTLFEEEKMQNHLYTFFQKVYTSPDILIFKRIGL